MNMITLIFSIFLFSFSTIQAKQEEKSTGMIIATKQIELKEYSPIWNPSLVKIKEGFLLSFRYCLAPKYPWISYIGIVLLDENLNPISKPQLLATRKKGDLTSSQAEDARLFKLNGEVYVLYNDNLEVENPTYYHRRDMFLAKLTIEGKEFKMEKPLKLYHSEKYYTSLIQKNWMPFEWKGQLLLAYSLNPHEILLPNLATGECHPVCESSFSCNWSWGEWRGGTPALLIDGEYFSFFHSSHLAASESSGGVSMYHYYMGAYSFSAAPPFEVKSASHEPIVAENFYTPSHYDKRVIFPGGITADGPNIYVAYGKDDNEVWLAIIDKNKLKKTMKSIKKVW